MVREVSHPSELEKMLQDYTEAATEELSRKKNDLSEVREKNTMIETQRKKKRVRKPRKMLKRSKRRKTKKMMT